MVRPGSDGKIAKKKTFWIGSTIVAKRRAAILDETLWGFLHEGSTRDRALVEGTLIVTDEWKIL